MTKYLCRMILKKTHFRKHFFLISNWSRTFQYCISHNEGGTVKEYRTRRIKYGTCFSRNVFKITRLHGNWVAWHQRLFEWVDQQWEGKTGNISSKTSSFFHRSTVADRVQIASVGNFTHATRDVIVPNASHSIILSRSISESFAFIGICAAHKSNPNSFVCRINGIAFDHWHGFSWSTTAALSIFHRFENSWKCCVDREWGIESGAHFNGSSFDAHHWLRGGRSIECMVQRITLINNAAYTTFMGISYITMLSADSQHILHTESHSERE